MKLLIGTESLIPPITGIGNYTLNLLQQFSLSEDISHIECFSGNSFFSAEEALARVHAQSEKDTDQKRLPVAARKGDLRSLIRRLPFAYRVRAAIQNIQLNARRRRQQSYIYHEPNFILKAHDGPCVATIHDLSFMHYPQFHPAERVSWMTSQLPKTLKRADFLITPSELVRQELMGEMGVPAHKVRRIYLGAASDYRPRTADETEALMSSLRLKHGKYVLFVASLEPRKGINHLLDAWTSLPKDLREEYPLVLAGAPGWKNETLQDRIGNLKASHGLRHLNYVSQCDLPKLYAGAAVFVYPSIYEGFGLPVLEAMQCGVAVVCTKGTTMDEFSAGAPLLCNPNEAEHLREQLKVLLEDNDLRRSVVNACIKRANDFSWRRCADETIEVYHSLL